MISLKEKLTMMIAPAIMIEAIITYINQFFVNGEFCWEMLLSMIFGIIISIAYDIDVTKHFNLSPRIPYISNILTGILLSRGSNYIYDLMTKLTCIN